MTDMMQIQKKLAHAVQQYTGLNLSIELLPPMTLERFEGKAKRVIDNRGITGEG
jgi:phenylacetate-CoA ligase